MARSDSSNGAITPEVFEHLVGLAALELSPEESIYLRKELNAQLGAIAELEAINVDPDAPITSHGVPYAEGITPSLREDEIRPCPEADDILAGVPVSDDRYILVPDIPHEELE